MRARVGGGRWRLGAVPARTPGRSRPGDDEALADANEIRVGDGVSLRQGRHRRPVFEGDLAQSLPTGDDVDHLRLSLLTRDDQDLPNMNQVRVGDVVGPHEVTQGYPVVSGDISKCVAALHRVVDGEQCHQQCENCSCDEGAEATS